MLATAHMLAGGAIGKTVRPAWLALPLALASHYVLDVVPHLDSHALFGGPGGPTRAEVAMAALDTLAGIALVALLARKLPNPGIILAAAFLGIAPDLENLPALGDWLRATPLAPAIAWHHAIQHNVTPAAWPLGLGTQLAVVLLAIGMMRSARRPARPVNHPAGPRAPSRRGS